MPALESSTGRPWFGRLLKEELDRWIDLSERQIDQLWRHYEVLLRWSEKISLTSIPIGREMVIRHYCESLFFAAHLPVAAETISLLDFGSGAGFPGVPIAVFNLAWRVTLLESNKRKTVFLRDSTRELPNISILAQRGASISTPFDWLVSRGVNLEEVLHNFPQLAPRMGLMLTEDDFSVIENMRGIAWREPVRLPWGDRTLCVFGEVSRGT